MIVTAGHRPSYTSGEYAPGATDLRAYLDTLGARHRKYVLDLSGHDHNYQRTFPQSGVVHCVVGNGGASQYAFGARPSWIAYRARHEGALRLRFTQAGIEGAMLCGPSTSNDDLACVPGTAIDTFFIPNPNPVVVNQPPTVSAGPDRTVTRSTEVLLDGTVRDDGLPSPAALTIDWSVLSGTGAITMESPTREDTRATFSDDGLQVLVLTASDGAFTVRDTVTITVAPAPPNQPPFVSAGPDRAVTIPGEVTMDGTVTDDGIPSPPSLTIAWSQISGPGAASFAAPNVEDARVTFPVAGDYRLRLAASDGAASAIDTVDVSVTVRATFERRIAAAADDAEESASGSVSTSSSDLELMIDGGVQRAVGLRFTNVTIPPRARITAAWVQFKSKEVQSEATSLVIAAQAADNAAAFSSAASGVSTRPRTNGVAWNNVPAWTATGLTGAAQRTPDLAAAIQAVVDRPQWRSGNALALIVTGGGHRTASSYENDRAGAPLLHVEYVAGPVALEQPTASATPDAPLSLRAVPNPARGAGDIRFTLARPGPVLVEMFDVRGARVGVLMRSDRLEAGEHRVEFDRSSGERLPAGVYFCRLRHPGGIATTRFMVLE
jgi:hypothetical protein